MMNNHSIRLITESDASEVLKLYEPYVVNTIVSFEYEVPAIDEFVQRIKTNTIDYPWLVSLNNEIITGFAYASRHRYRTAYQWSAESTIYLSSGFQGKGIARVLYETLFSLLRLQGYFNVYAGVGLPNEKSVGFHKALGFEEIGIFKKIGYKLGNWHDTYWFQLQITEQVSNPPTPKKLNEILEDDAFKKIMVTANEKINKLKYMK
jgi:L-amino acid N-acyltransferase YncA